MLDAPQELKDPTPETPAAAGAVSTNLLEIIRLLADKAEPLIALFGSTLEQMQKGRAAEARYRVRMTSFAVLIVALMIAVAGGLTYSGKVDGSAFTFLLGTIVGAMLSFILRTVAPPE